MIYTFILSFKGNQAASANFVGFENYSTILFGKGSAAGAMATHQEFAKALGNTLILWFGNFIPQILLSLLLAVWFTDAKVKLPGKGFFKIVMYMPNIITAASVAALYVNLFGDSKYYFINATLMKMGMAEPIQFIANEWNAKFMVMFIQTWLWFGNTM
ncbi:MAG: sugar ABC transporter permease, partial [Oscillospiraceae bacterium]|nr:sugar ABC transporter permease [Oscillospiraceae bacterium]